MVKQSWGLTLISAVHMVVAFTLAGSNVLWQWVGWELVMIGALCFVITNALVIFRANPSFAVLVGIYGGILATIMPAAVLGIIEPLPYVYAGLLGCAVGCASGKVLSHFHRCDRTKGDPPTSTNGSMFWRAS